MADKSKGWMDSIKDAIWAEKGKSGSPPVGRGGANRRARMDEMLDQMERGTPDRMRRNQSTDEANR